MTSFSSFSRVALSAMFLIAIAFPLLAYDDSEITSTSPNGRWTVVAHWTDVNRGGYIYELRDNTTHKVFLKQTTFQKDDAFPQHLAVLWSSDSTRVAISLYYGRIAYWVTVVDTTLKSPDQVSLTPLEKGDYIDYQTYANRWLNRTDLEITAIRPSQWQEGRIPGKEAVLVLRLTGNSVRLLKKAGN